MNKKCMSSIKGNVDAVEKMSAIDIFEKSYDDNGCVIFNMNSISFQELLSKIEVFSTSKSDTDFIDADEFISNIIAKNDGSFSCFRPSQRCLQLDSDTLQAIADVTTTRQHELTGSNICIALPGLANECSTCLAIPISQEFMTKNPPDFKTLANNEKFAHFRIALRKTITDTHSTRNLHIDVGSTLLGASLSMLFLEALEMFTKDMNNKPEEDSNVQMIIRGLLGFTLTTMASGVNGQVKGWDIFNDETAVPITMESWKIYQRIMLQARLADWITPKVMKNYNKITSDFVSVHNSK